MRVIAGTARSLKLETPPGLDVRPTTDRIKETLFNIINNHLYGCDFLDLFSGSGAIGIEALSRGADTAAFVDNSAVSLEYVRKNLEHTHLAGKAEVIRSDAVSAIKRLASQNRSFDIIFMDPPYDHELEKAALQAVSECNILKENGIVIIEALENTDFAYVEDMDFDLYRTKSYGSNKHVFLERRQK